MRRCSSNWNSTLHVERTEAQSVLQGRFADPSAEVAQANTLEKVLQNHNVLEERFAGQTNELFRSRAHLQTVKDQNALKRTPQP